MHQIAHHTGLSEPELSGVETPILAPSRPGFAPRFRDILAAALVGVLVAGFAYGAVAHFMILPYLENQKREGRVRNFFPFYRAHRGDGLKNAALVLGSSQVLEGMDAALVEARLPVVGSAPAMRVYNLGMSGESPISRLYELEALKRTAPRFVVYCVGSFGMSYKRSPVEDQVIMVADLLENPGEQPWRDILPENLRAALDRSRAGRFLTWRKFFIPALEATWKRRSSHLRYADHNHNFRDPWQYLTKPDPSSVEQLLRATNPPELAWYVADFISDSPRRPNADRRAFRYLLDDLARMRKQHGTALLVIDMPINPLVTKVRPEIGRWLKPYREFLRRECAAHGIPLLLWDGAFPPEMFSDLLHLAAPGRRAFSRRLGDVLAQRLAPR